MTWRIHTGDCREVLQHMPPESVQCCITSPPYWGLRDYGVPPQIWGGDSACDHFWGEEQKKKGGGGQPGAKKRWQHTGRGVSGHPEACAGSRCTHCDAWFGSLGLERTPEEYVLHLVDVFREVRRVLRGDGTLWLNLGDCYATGAGKVGKCPGGGEQGARWAGKRRALRDGRHAGKSTAMTAMGPMTQPNRLPILRLKPKDLVGIPWRVAFALQAEGWWLRSDIVWAKTNPMPESVTDRPTKSHEYLFLLSKSESYFYDKGAVLEPYTTPEPYRQKKAGDQALRGQAAIRPRGNLERCVDPKARYFGNDGRNRRSVWTIATRPFSGAHFAVMPTGLVKPCILAGSRPGDTVLDPFAGAGTVGLVATREGRNFVGIDLSPEYVTMAERRIIADAPLLNRPKPNPAERRVG